MHRHASTRSCRREQHSRERTNRNTGTSSCPSNGGTAERESARAEDAGTEEESRRRKDDTRDCSRKSQEQESESRADEMEKLMHHDECSACREWLDLGLCAKARREEVEYTHRHKMYTGVPREVCLRETGEAPIKTGWAETDKGQPGMPNVGREGIQDAREARVVRVDAHAELRTLEVSLDPTRAVGVSGGTAGQRSPSFPPGFRRTSRTRRISHAASARRAL